MRRDAMIMLQLLAEKEEREANRLHERIALNIMSRHEAQVKLAQLILCFTDMAQAP
jgi:hypothetical protein